MSSNNNSDDPKNKVSRRDFFRASTRIVGAPAQEIAKPSNTRRVLGRHNSTSSAMSRRTFVKVAAAGAAVTGLVIAAPKILPGVTADQNNTKSLNYKGKVTTADRKAAAASRPKGTAAPTVVPAPGGTPDYFGTTPNYANSPLPTIGAPAPGAGVTLTGFALQSGGSGYTTPAVVLTGGGGTGATATARVSNGVILGFGANKSWNSLHFCSNSHHTGSKSKGKRCCCHNDNKQHGWSADNYWRHSQVHGFPASTQYCKQSRANVTNSCGRYDNVSRK